jgi:beta-lactamase class A
MSATISRRTTLTGALLALPAFAPAFANDAETRLVALERSNGGRLGVAVLDLGTGRRISHRADERFALCSTFKFLAASLVLDRVDRGREQLNRRVTFTEKDLVPNSPATKEHVGTGMTMAEICRAAITLSDNTAGNLMLASFGGPAALTAYARTVDDDFTRLDRIETDLNEARTGDPRDTTTPAAMTENLRRIVLGDALSETSRRQMADWLLANQTGAERLRAGLPKDWRIGDKTGTGDNGAANDIAVIWPPGRAPLIVSVYFAEAAIPAGARNGVIADIGRIVAGI